MANSDSEDYVQLEIALEEIDDLVIPESYMKREGPMLAIWCFCELTPSVIDSQSMSISLSQSPVQFVMVCTIC